MLGSDITSLLENCGSGSRSSSCKWRAVSSNPRSPLVIVSLIKTLHPSCALLVVVREPQMPNFCLPQGHCGYSVAYSHQCLNVCMTECNVLCKHSK